MKIIQETIHADGSAWAAVIEVSGILFHATYVASVLSVGMARYMRPPSAPVWGIRTVTEWAQERIEALSPKWMALHVAMYGTAVPTAIS